VRSAVDAIVNLIYCTGHKQKKIRKKEVKQKNILAHKKW